MKKIKKCKATKKTVRITVMKDRMTGLETGRCTRCN